MSRTAHAACGPAANGASAAAAPGPRFEHALRVALFEPDIPQNTAAIVRTAACFGAAVDLIEPAGFRLAGPAVRRAGLDYLDLAHLERHIDWAAFREAARGVRVVLFTTRADHLYTEFAFRAGDVLLFGRESAGVPAAVHEAADARVRIPIVATARSLNLAAAVAVGLSEAVRQLASAAAA